MNLEYRIPIAGPVAMSLFNDIGTVGIIRKGGLLLAPTGIDNINNLFPLANQQAQLQIAPGHELQAARFRGHRVHRQFADRAGAVPDLLRL